MPQIAYHKVVALRYCMKNAKGDVLEDTMQSAPINYLHGSQAILPLLQQQLEGLRIGDKKQVLLLQSDSNAGDDFIFDVIIDDVREATLEEIVLGYPLQLTTNKCDEYCACYKPGSLNE